MMFALVARSGSPSPALEPAERPPLAADEVRVEVAAAGFTLYDAAAAADPRALGLPDVVGLGFDFGGTVLEAGSDVTRFAAGDVVAGLHVDVRARARAHATEVVVPEGAVAPVPAGLRVEIAAAATLNALAARQAVAGLVGTGRLLVTGAAGGVGSIAVALASRAGWKADALVRGTGDTVAGAADVLTELSDPPTAAYDAVIDAAALQERALGLVREGGQLVGFKPGQPVTPVRGIGVTTVLTEPDGTALADLLTLVADGTVPVRLAGTRSLSRAAAAYAEAMSAPGSAGRWVLTP